MQRVISAVHTNRVLDSDVLGKMRFEVAQLLAQDEIAARKRVGDCVIDFRFESPIVFLWVDETDAVQMEISEI